MKGRTRIVGSDRRLSRLASIFDFAATFNLQLGLLVHYREEIDPLVDFSGKRLSQLLNRAHKCLGKRTPVELRMVPELLEGPDLSSFSRLGSREVNAQVCAPPVVLARLGVFPTQPQPPEAWSVSFTPKYTPALLANLNGRFAIDESSRTLLVILVLLPALRENRPMRGDLAKQFAEVLKTGDAGEAAKTLGSYFQAYPTELGELQAPDNFDELRVVREAFGLAMKTRLEASLCDRLASLENATPDAKRKFTIGLRDELDALDLRVQCPECHQAATLRFGRKGNMEEAFSFDHTQPPRSSHASSVNVPTELTLMLKPPDRRRGDIGRFPDEPKREQSRPAEPAYMHNLRELVARVAVGDTSPTDKGDLLRVLREAKKESPPDRAAFVNLVNRALDALGLRIKLSDGSLAKLRITPGATGKGFIQFKLFGYPGSSRGWGQDRPTGLAPLP